MQYGERGGPATIEFVYYWQKWNFQYYRESSLCRPMKIQLTIHSSFNEKLYYQNYCRKRSWSVYPRAFQHIQSSPWILFRCSLRGWAGDRWRSQSRLQRRPEGNDQHHYSLYLQDSIQSFIYIAGPTRSYYTHVMFAPLFPLPPWQFGNMKLSTPVRPMIVPHHYWFDSWFLMCLLSPFKAFFFLLFQISLTAR